MKHSLFIIFVALLAILSPAPAEAHRPFVKRVQSLESPTGSLLILEKLYGDGIFFADPVRIQVRNKNGVVLAHSQTSTHAGVFCPSVTFCWAFPYENLLVEPLMLAHQRLNYDELNKNELPADLSGYMAGSVDTVRSDSFDYPSYNDKPRNFVTGSSLIKLLSPLIIIIDNLWSFLILAAVYFLPSFLFPTFWGFSLSKKGAGRFWQLFTGILIALPFGALAVGVTFIDLFTLSLPLVYSLLIAVLSIWGGLRLSKKFSRKLPSRPIR